MTFTFKTSASDIKAAITLMLFCKRSGIECAIDQDLTAFLYDAILQKLISPGEYYELFNGSMFETLDELILIPVRERKHAFVEERRKTVPKSPEYVLLTQKALECFAEEDVIESFLTKAYSDDPDSVCGCSSVSCTNWH